MTIQDARAQVAQQFGWINFDGSASAYSNLSQADQVKLSDALMSYIVTNSGAFSDAQVTEARRVAASKGFNSPLADDSFNYTQFGDEVLNNAKKEVDIGGGILKNVIYIAAIIGVLAYVLPSFLTRYDRAKAATP